MKKPRRNRVLVAASALGGLVLLGAGLAYASWDYLLEDRYIRDLEEGDWFDQGHAAMKLGEIRSRKAVPALARLVRSGDLPEPAASEGEGATMRQPLELVERSFRLLGAFFGEDVQEPLRFIEDLGNPRVMVRMHAIAALGKMGAHAGEAVPALVEAAKHPSVTIRTFSTGALGDVGLDPAIVVPALAAALSDPEKPVRRNAAMALARFGRAALPAADRLRLLLEDSDSDLRRIARESLERIAASP
jgi:HEAT repeat protein